MIPGVISRFLSEASVGAATTRDANLAPQVYLISGWSAAPDQSEMRLLFGGIFLDRLQADLKDNGRIAVTIERIGAHETYQFKGRCLDLRPVQDEDRALNRACRERFVRAVKPLFDVADDVLGRHIPDPTLAVRMDVEEIYIQTPGPKAGTRLIPRGGA